MFGLPSLYLRFAGYGAAALLIGGAGYKIGASHWETKYRTLQAADYQGLAQREQVARKALEGQLAQARAVSANNESAIEKLTHDNAQLTSNRDANLVLVRRLLSHQARSAASPVLPKTSGIAAVTGAGGTSEDAGLEAAVADVADECERNSNRLDALIQQISAQL